MALLAAVADSADPEILGHALLQLRAVGALEAVAGALIARVPQLPDTTVDRILGALSDPPPDPAAIELVAELHQTLGVERVIAWALTDRWLKRWAPQRRDHDRHLMTLDGARLAGLAAGPRGPEVDAFAASVLDALARAPKSLSQARAEALLAGRVYAEPAHFLLELLQNAEDTGARRWRVEITADEVVIWHDGAPFCTADVVGVLSIGQTTKTGGQIGMFGVGFKSVYAVAGRPAIYSGPFRFEIAGISVPRPLAPPTSGPRAQACARGGTTLALPLLDPDDPVRGREALARAASQIPPETLLTLRALSSVELIGGGLRLAYTRRIPDASALPVITIADGAGGVQRFGVAEAGEVRVAVRLDDADRPRPWGPGPSVFCFLPTAERPGLRFLVHAPFTLPVDRERLVRGEARNPGLLAEAGRLLLALLSELRSAPGVAPAALLEILPDAEEVTDPLYRPLLDAIAGAAAGVALLPGADGSALAPGSAAVLDDARLTSLLAGRPVHGARRLLAPLAPRARRIALQLGARPLTPGDLRPMLAGALGELQPGDQPPPWLAEALPVLLDRLGPDASALGSALMLPDDAGRLWPVPRIVRIEPALRPAYARVRPLLAAALDQHPTGPQAALWQQLALPTLGPAELVADLQDPGQRAALLASGRLLEALEALPDAALQPLAALPLFSDDQGCPGPLQGPDRLWCVPDGALGAWLRGLPPGTARLASAALQAHHPRLLRVLGASWLGLEALCAQLTDDTLSLDRVQLERLLDVLDAGRADLTARQAHALAACPIFADTGGQLRPLAGPDAAWLAGDDTIATILVDRPWLSGVVADRPLIAALGIAARGPLDVAQVLLDGPAPADPALLQRASAYLAPRAHQIPPALVARLAAAPIWLGADGVARPLDQLRCLQDDPVLDALYAAWGVLAPLPPGPSLALARALRLDPGTSGPRQLVTDLCTLQPPDPSCWPQLVAALSHPRVVALPPGVLAPLADRPLFRDPEGAPGCLGHWGTGVPDPGALYRVPRRLALLGRRLRHLDPADAQQLAPLLDALGVREAGIEELVAALADGPLDAPEDRAAGRRLLAQLAPELAQRWPEGLALLADLALWPTPDDEALHPPAAIVRGEALAADLGALGPLVQQALGPLQIHPLDPSARDDAAALAPQLPFADPAALLCSAVAAQARPGEPLHRQPPLIDSPDRLLAVFTVATGAGLEAPRLSVDRAGVLVSGWSPHADAPTMALIDALGLELPLADPAWGRAVGALDPRYAPPLLPRRLLIAWEPLDLAAILADAPETRRALFAWLGAYAGAIADDPEARARLGRSPVVPAADGRLRAPTELVLVPVPPGLGLPWGLDPEVPAPLASWLAATYRLGEGQLDRAVADLLDANQHALDAGDAPRSAALLGLLARLLHDADPSPQGFARLARLRRIPRRLRIFDASGGIDWPRRMLAPSPGHQAQIASFLAEPPRTVGPGYLQEEGVGALLRALGAADELRIDQLEPAVAGRGLREGLQARIALAHHLAERIVDEPALVATLRLHDRAWIPDAAGQLQRPDALCWPEEGDEALLEHVPSLQIEPGLHRALPEALRTLLPFQRVPALEHVVVPVDGQPLEPAILDWLERGLARRDLTPSAVRLAIGAQRCLLDDRGQVRAASELVLRQDVPLLRPHSATFSDAARLPHLVQALRIPERAGPDQLVAALAQIAERLERQGAEAALQRSPPGQLIAVLAQLAEADVPPPTPLPVVGIGPGGALILALLPGGAWLPAPEALIGPAVEAGLVLLELSAQRTEATWLARAGARDLWGAVQLRGVGGAVREPDDPAQLEALAEGIARAWAAHPGLGPTGLLQRPPQVQVVDDLVAEVTLGGKALVVPVDALASGRTLAVRPGALGDLRAIARALLRQSDPGGTPSDARLEAIAALLARAPGRLPRPGPAQPAPVQPAPTQPAPAQLEPAQPAPTPAPERPPARPEDPDTPLPDPPGRGLFDELRDWWRSRSEPAPEAPRPPASGGAPPGSDPRPPSPVRAPSDDRWFQDRRRIELQLHSDGSWARDRSRAPEYGFATSPAELPAPWCYAPGLIADRFDPVSQAWTARRIEARWSHADASIRGTVRLRGRLPRGASLVPTPLFAELIDAQGEDLRTVRDRRGRASVVLRRPTEVTLTLALREPAVIIDKPLAPPGLLLAPTVPDDELPVEVLQVCASLAAHAPPPAQIAEEIRDLIRSRYRYDPTYLEDPDHAAWLRRASLGRPNAHIAALHAGRDARHLGAGVCYELNVLAVELMRRSGVGAAVATGWTFDRGAVSEPDHLWAMALVPTTSGPRWLPIDASTTDTGRPLHAGPRPRGPWSPPEGAEPPPPPPEGWHDRSPGRRGGPRPPRSPPRPGPTPPPTRGPTSDLLGVLRHLEALSGQRSEPGALRRWADRLAGDPDAARALLRWLRDTD